MNFSKDEPILPMLTCNCCFETLDESQSVTCESGNHTSCTECVNSALKVANSEHRPLHCFECQGKFKNLHLVCENTDVDKLNDLLTILSLKDNKIFSCTKCEFSFNIDNSDIIFACPTVDCGMEYCTKCRKEYHYDKECEVETTEKFVIRCCNVSFILHDGCNKLTCPVCKSLYCWECKSKIYGYEHFRIGKCEMYIGGRRFEERRILGEQEIQLLHPRHQRYIRAQNIENERLELLRLGLLRVQCRGVTRKGVQCKRTLNRHEIFCKTHNPNF